MFKFNRKKVSRLVIFFEVSVPFVHRGEGDVGLDGVLVLAVDAAVRATESHE